MSNNGNNMNGLTAVKRDLTKEMSDVLLSFHSYIFKLIKLVKKCEPNNPDIEWLQNKAALARDVDPLIIINKCKDKFWHYRDQILERDIDFFLNNKFSKFIKNDENKTFMHTLLNIFKKKIIDLSDAEKNMLWDIMHGILLNIVQYKKLSGDYLQT
jgi:hypothetical protein